MAKFRLRKVALRSVMRGALAALLGFIVMVAIGEAALHVGHFIRKNQLDNNVRPSRVESNGRALPVVTIATIGESTTAPWLLDGQDISWPRQLETQLNNGPLGKKFFFSVINLGQTSVPSAILIRSLESQLESLRPDFVISMMGINDSISLNIDESFLYRNSYAYRFLFWALVAIRCPLCQEVDHAPAPNRPRELTSSEKAAEKAVRSLESLDHDSPMTDAQFHQFIEQVSVVLARSEEFKPELNVRVARIVLRRLDDLEKKSPIQAQRLKQSVDAKDALKNLAQALRESHASVSDAEQALIELCRLNNKLGSTCDEDLLNAFAKGIRPTPQLLTWAIQGGEKKKPEVYQLLRREGLNFQLDSSPFAATVTSYKKLRELAKEHGFIWFAMQYPTGSISAIKSILSNRTDPFGKSFCSVFYAEEGSTAELATRDVRFISNSNFNRVFVDGRASEYFLDFFARSCGLNFGHTTKKGSDLIARNAAEALIENWNWIQPKIQRQ